VAEKQRGWEVEVVPLVVGQRSVKEKEWLETLKIFGIGKEDGKKIINRLGDTFPYRTRKDFWELLVEYIWVLQYLITGVGEEHIGQGLPTPSGWLETRKKKEKKQGFVSMSVGVMKDYKLKLRKLRVSDTLGWSWNWNT